MIPIGMYSILEQVYNVESGIIPFHSIISKVSTGLGFQHWWYLKLQITKDIEPPVILVDYEKINQPQCIVPLERILRKLPVSKQNEEIAEYLSDPFWVYTYLRPYTIVTSRFNRKYNIRSIKTALKYMRG